MKKLLVLLTLWASVASAQTVGQGEPAANSAAWPIKVTFSGSEIDPRAVSQLATQATTLTLQNAATADGNGTEMDVTGLAAVMFTTKVEPLGGGCTLTWQVSQDGTNFSGIFAMNTATKKYETSTQATSVTVRIVNVAGATKFRVVISNYVFGDVTVTATGVPLTTAFTESSVGTISGVVPLSATLVGGNNAGFMTPVDVTTAEPIGTEAGFVVRNIPSGTQAVSAVDLPLPIGASTSANQDTEITSLASIDGKTPALVAGRVPVDPSGVTSPVSVASLPLPSGAATAALQTQPGVDIGDVTVNNGAGAGAVPIQDGGNTITVDATDLDVHDLTFARDKVDASGSAVTVSAGSAIIGKVGIDQTTPGTTNGVQINAALPTGANAIGKLAANNGVDIGDVTVNNAVGAAAVNIQDGGNSITVDGAVNAVQSGVWVTTIDDGAGSITVDGPLTNAELRLDPVDITTGVYFGTSAFATVPLFSLGGIDDDLSQWMYINSRQSAPSGFESGLITRNIPSGTQNAAVVSALPTGTNNIGDVDIASAIPAGNNNIGDVDVASIAAGANVIGKVGIDQTTPGTTNGVQVNAALPAGANNIGEVFTRPSVRRSISISGQESVAAPVADVWYIRKQWALPASALFTPSHAWAAVTTALTKTTFVIANNLGNLNVGTNTYTAANSVVSPFFYSRLFGCVTTIFSATPDTITPTYTDELGNSQAATGVAFAASTPVGNCYEFPLATSGVVGSALDSGVRAVTAAVDTAATTGVVTFYGVTTMADFAGTAAGQTETIEFPPATSPELAANEQVIVLMRQAATTAQLKTFGIAGTIK